MSDIESSFSSSKEFENLKGDSFSSSGQNEISLQGYDKAMLVKKELENCDYNPDSDLSFERSNPSSVFQLTATTNLTNSKPLRRKQSAT